MHVNCLAKAMPTLKLFFYSYKNDLAQGSKSTAIISWWPTITCKGYNPFKIIIKVPMCVNNKSFIFYRLNYNKDFLCIDATFACIYPRVLEERGRSSELVRRELSTSYGDGQGDVRGQGQGGGKTI